MEKINIDGINIAFERRGSGPALVLIHGYPLDHTIWDETAPLLEADFDLIIPDLRGFGQSDVMEADDSMIGFASDMAGLLTHLKIRTAALAGHSMGGYVALAFAREYPDRVAGLGLVSSQVLADPPDRKQARYATAEKVLQHGMAEVVESMTPKLSADPRLQEYARELISKQRPLGVYSALTAMAERLDCSDLLPTFTYPVVLIHGEADALIPPERAREVKAAIPHAHLVELAGVGHLPMLEDPQATAQALRNLLPA
jgi:pimeloyl-ACP methyl ester carboxylesterase